MSLVHRSGMVRINKAPDVVSADNFRIPNGLNRLDGRWRRGPDNELRTRGARGNEHERNECEIFHGWTWVDDLLKAGTDIEGTATAEDPKRAFSEGLFSSANGFAEPPIAASLRSIVCRT